MLNSLAIFNLIFIAIMFTSPRVVALDSAPKLTRLNTEIRYGESGFYYEGNEDESILTVDAPSSKLDGLKVISQSDLSELIIETLPCEQMPLKLNEDYTIVGECFRVENSKGFESGDNSYLVLPKALLADINSNNFNSDEREGGLYLWRYISGEHALHAPSEGMYAGNKFYDLSSGKSADSKSKVVVNYPYFNGFYFLELKDKDKYEEKIRRRELARGQRLSDKTGIDIDMNYYQKNNHIYLNDQHLEGISAIGFQFLYDVPSIVADYANLYFLTFNMSCSDACSYTSVKSIDKVDGIDMSRFQILNERPLLVGNEDRLIYIDLQAPTSKFELIELEDIDPKNFHIKGPYIIDKETMVHIQSGQKVENAVPGTLELIYLQAKDNITGELSGKYVSYYAKDSNQVYYHGHSFPKIIEGADPNTFVLLSNYHSKDSESAYHYTNKIEGADPATFTEISLTEAEDMNHRYSSGKRIEKK